MTIEDQIFELMEQAFEKMKEASFQSHYGHWDREGTRGLNCPECIRAKELRHEAAELMDQAKRVKAIAENGSNQSQSDLRKALADVKGMMEER